MLYEVNVKWVI